MVEPLVFKIANSMGCAIIGATASINLKHIEIRKVIVELTEIFRGVKQSVLRANDCCNFDKCRNCDMCLQRSSLKNIEDGCRKGACPRIQTNSGKSSKGTAPVKGKYFILFPASIYFE